MGPKPQSKPGPSNGGKKPLRGIQKTEDLLKHNVHAKRRGQGKERAVLKGLHDLVKGGLHALRWQLTVQHRRTSLDPYRSSDLPR